MSNKVKKILAFVLAAVMMTSLAACGNNVNETTGQTDGPKATEAPKGTEAPKETEAPKDEYDPYGKYDETLKITLAGQIVTTQQPNGDMYNDNAYWDYIKDVLNVELEYEIEAANTADFTKALGLAIAGGELPDIIISRDYALVTEMVNEGLVWDLTEVIENYASDAVKEQFAGYDFDVFKKVTYDDKIMAIPRVFPESGATVMVRQDWLDKLGITVDADGDGLLTREELEMIATEFVENDPGNSGNPVGFALQTSAEEKGNYSVAMICHSFGAPFGWWVQKDDGEVVYGSTMPEMKDALSWWADMYDKGLLDVQYGVTKSADIKAMFVNGQLGISFGEFAQPSWFLNDVYAADENANFACYGLDNGTGQESWGWMDNQNRYILVSKECENPEVAVKLYNLYFDLYCGNLATDEIATNYPDFYETYASLTKTGDIGAVDPLGISCGLPNLYVGRKESVEAWKAGELAFDDITFPGAKSYANALKAEAEGTETVSTKTWRDSYDGVHRWVTLMDSGKLDMTLYLSQISTDVIGMYKADLDTLVQEMLVKIITGEEPVEYFDTFVEEWEARGGKETIKEYEAFYK